MAIIPTTTPPKPAYAQHISQYVTDLRSIVGYYLPWIEETSHDVELFYDTLQNDPTVKHASHLLSLMVAGEKFEITGKHKRFNDIVQQGLSYIERFNHVRKSMCEKAVIYGLSVQKKEWGRVKFPDHPGMTWEVPVRLKEVDRRRMRIERDTQYKNRMYWTVWDPRLDEYVILEDRHYNPKAYAALQDYIFYWNEHEETSPYFRGLGEVMYGIVYIRNKALQYWSDLSERWGNPLLVATMDAVRAAYNSATQSGSGPANATTIINNYLDILENMRSRNVAVFPDHDKLQVHEGGSTGNNIIAQLIEYCDKRIQLLILGAELTTSAPSVGSYAMGQLHKGATNSIVMYHRQGIEENIERDLVYDFYHRNRLNFLKLGIRWPGVNGFQFETKVEQEEQREEMLEKMPAGKKSLEQAGVTG